MPVSETAAAWRSERPQQRRLELEADREHVERQRELGEAVDERHRSGLKSQADTSGANQPSSDGPSRKPVTISAMTWAWPSRGPAAPSACRRR